MCVHACVRECVHASLASSLMIIAFLDRAHRRAGIRDDRASFGLGSGPKGKVPVAMVCETGPSAAVRGVYTSDRSIDRPLSTERASDRSIVGPGV